MHQVHAVFFSLCFSDSDVYQDTFKLTMRMSIYVMARYTFKIAMDYQHLKMTYNCKRTIIFLLIALFRSLSHLLFLCGDIDFEPEFTRCCRFTSFPDIQIDVLTS